MLVACGSLLRALRTANVGYVVSRVFASRALPGREQAGTPDSRRSRTHLPDVAVEGDAHWARERGVPSLPSSAHGKSPMI